MTVDRLLLMLVRPFRDFSKRSLAGAKRASGIRIMFWSTLAALVIGVLGLAQPIDDFLRVLRDRARPFAPSSQITLVSIDDRSVEQMGAWPWDRSRYAEMVDALKAAGAKRIFFDIFFNTRSAPAHDRRFAKALKDAGNVYLASTFITDTATHVRRIKLPRPEFTKYAGVISVSTNFSGVGHVRGYPYARQHNGNPMASMAAKLANVDGPIDKVFPIDYALDFKNINEISAVDTINRTFRPEDVHGKDIVIGVTSNDIGDIYYLFGRGYIKGVYLNIAGAETLRRGKPILGGWFGPVIAAFLIAIVINFTRRRWLSHLATVVGALGALCLPIFAEENHLVFETVPALILIVTAGGSSAWFNFRRSYKVRGNINAISGLPNLNALRVENQDNAGVVVAARIMNFAEISSSLPQDGEKALVDQIVARLSLGARGARIYQGDEGIFVWVTTLDVVGSDQLDALHALFRSPALIEGRPIDLALTFGIDTGVDRTLANRIGATLVAADEAAVEGMRWKAYDPAKLADAEWKLSLLGRLDAAIDSGEVWVAYQPQLDLRTGQLCGAEALVRWSHPEKGEVSPMEFVLAAEQHNRIDKLTAFVLGDAICAAAAFHARGVAFDIAVNISARSLEKPGLVPMVRQLLCESGLPPERLTLEITESAALTSDRTSIRTLEEVGSLGINVSIDDYGTGFSTLEYFKKIPATEVKIDRSFVGAIDRNASDRVMVESTIEMAHSLGRSVVAEGVETKTILAELTKLGCDRAQGYLIGRPMKLVNLQKLFPQVAAVRAA